MEQPQFLLPKKKKINLNLILILINAAAFIIFTILISAKIITIDDIALKPSNILQGNYLWTFLTSMFMHASFLHIFANMLSLLFVGSLIERILGKKRYLFFYIAAGLFAGIFFVIASFFLANYFNLPGDFNTYAVGASGAIFGLVGLLMLLTPNLPVYMFFIPIPIKMKYAAPVMLIILWIISITANVGIGNTAHLGGLIFGLIYGVYLRRRYKNKTKYLRKYFS
ncbi:MAG TPA: rhomboid family intramembrane serine protease [Patescibacteria group bacterium]|nr:rhomboid family intramembrane serine protease [Patescibacteria group bacterium]